MRLRLGWVAVPALAVAFAFLSLAPVRADAAPVTLVSGAGWIPTFAHDGGRIAWVGYQRKVHIKTLWNGRAAVVGHARQNGYAGAGGRPGNFDPHQIALAGDRALWLTLAGGNAMESLLRTAALSDRVARPAGYFAFLEFAGRAPTRLAGDGQTLAYGWVRFEEFNVDEPDHCSAVTDGGAVRVEGRRTIPVGGSARPAMLAVSAGKLALVPADERCDPDRVHGGQGGFPVLEPAVNGTVEVRNAASGQLLSSFAPAGAVQAIAMSGPVVAVLVRNAAGGMSIQRYSAVDGTLIGSTWVSPGIANELDMAGETIVFRTGPTIRTMDVETGQKSALWIAPVIPVDLSIEGKRIAWAENPASVGGRVPGRIRAVLLP
jgi:hypothetical protein